MAELVAGWALRGPEGGAAAERALGRIAAVDGTVRAFVDEPGRRERVLREAAAAQQSAHQSAQQGAHQGAQPGAGPGGGLAGVPVGVKDVIRVDGLPTRAGSALPPAELGGPEAAVVTRLRAAGAVIAGKTVTAEFAAIAPNETRNPHDPGHTPGGSSSGSAAAVAAGMVPLAIGTQTIGSVIRPAAYCGVAGFKPTHGRIPTAGVIGNAPTCDTVGIFATDLAGIEIAAAALCDDWAPTRPTEQPVIGVPTGRYADRLEPAAAELYDTQLRRLEAAGYELRERPEPADPDGIRSWQRVLNRYELARVHERWFAAHAERYRPQTANAIREGQRITAAEHAAALVRRAEFRDRLAGSGVDVWVTPPATGPAPAGLDSTGDPVLCVAWSVAGMPALALPAGVFPGGLPAGVQLAARPGADEALLGWAARLAGVLTGG